MLNQMYTVKIWSGEMKPVKKITMYPEKDKQGDIFYKIEGQFNLDYFMIGYYYDKDKAKDAFGKLLNALIDFQAETLLTD